MHAKPIFFAVAKIGILTILNSKCMLLSGLQKSFHPTIRDGITWSKFGARGEHGDVLRFSNLGALWFSENRAPFLG